jgi:hypothetical protein
MPIGVHPPVVHLQVPLHREGLSKPEDAAGFLVHDQAVRARDV